ncbi:MAG: DUF2096 domain-containing protein [archaeon]|nr:DUF2096 domain-containing protein [archaeon]
MSVLPVEQSWIILVNLSADLKKKGIETPAKINKDLGLIKSQISFYKKDTSHPDMINEMARADMALNEIQGILLSLAEDCGDEYYQGWLDKLNRANRGEIVYELSDHSSKFLLNPPPGFSYAKITMKNPIAEERVQEIAEVFGIIMEFDTDLTVALYGDKADVQAALREMTPFFTE